MTEQTTPAQGQAAEALPLPAPPSPRSDWALFLDIDGTLLDIADSPENVSVSEQLRADLEAAAKHLNGALALVSGRTITDIDKLFDPLRLAASGQHGSEWRPTASAAAQPVVEQPLPIGLHEAAAQLSRLHPGIVVERKSHALAVHYRHAPALGPEVGSRLAQAMSGLEGLMLMPGKFVWEIKDASQSKGTAVERFLQQPAFANRLPVFVGDDRTDEDGFRAVEKHGGLSLAVGPMALRRPTLPGFIAPAAVRGWIGDFARTMA
jgi:trehalose 6-phosphate phosphatase